MENFRSWIDLGSFVAAQKKIKEKIGWKFRDVTFRFLIIILDCGFRKDLDGENNGHLCWGQAMMKSEWARGSTYGI